MSERSDRLRATQREQRSTGSLAGLVLLLGVSVPITIWQGFIVKTLWNWFIPSAFPGVPRLAIGTAVGVMLVISLFTPTSEPKDGESLTSFGARRIYETIIEGTVALAFGLVVHWIVR